MKFAVLLSIAALAGSSVSPGRSETVRIQDGSGEGKEGATATPVTSFLSLRCKPESISEAYNHFSRLMAYITANFKGLRPVLYSEVTDYQPPRLHLFINAEKLGQLEAFWDAYSSDEALDGILKSGRTLFQTETVLDRVRFDETRFFHDGPAEDSALRRLDQEARQALAAFLLLR